MKLIDYNSILGPTKISKKKAKLLRHQVDLLVKLAKSKGIQVITCKALDRKDFK